MEEVENPFQLQGDHDDMELQNFVNEPTPSLYASSPGAETPEQKYARLKAREAELLRRQQEIREVEGVVAHQPNWPPYIPFLYVDIETDIPQAAQQAVKIALIGVALVISQSIINILASSTITGLANYSRAKSVIFSVIFALVTVYVTVSLCWEKLYNGCRARDLPFSFIVWQFVLIAWTGYLAVGFPSSGSVGIATFIDLIAKSESGWSKTIATFNTLMLIGSIAIHIIVLQQAQKYQKVSGVPDIMQPMVSPDVSSI